MLKVEVDRKRWYRGESEQDSLLLKKDGRMCCLGFVCEAAGLHKSAFRDISVPAELNVVDQLVLQSKTQVLCKSTRLTALQHTDACESAIEVNDDDLINDEEREKTLIKLGKRMGIEFTFTG